MIIDIITFWKRPPELLKALHKLEYKGPVIIYVEGGVGEK